MQKLILPADNELGLLDNLFGRQSTGTNLSARAALLPSHGKIFTRSFQLENIDVCVLEETTPKCAFEGVFYLYVYVS